MGNRDVEYASGAVALIFAVVIVLLLASVPFLFRGLGRAADANSEEYTPVYEIDVSELRLIMSLRAEEYLFFMPELSRILVSEELWDVLKKDEHERLARICTIYITNYAGGSGYKAEIISNDSGKVIARYNMKEGLSYE